MVMTDSIPETDPIREQGRKTTSFEESLRWIQEKLAKYDAADNQDAKSTGLQDPQTMIPHELPKSSPIPRISFPRKPIGESATLKEKIRWLESPSSTETERLKFPSIFKSDDRVAMVKSKQGAYDPPPRPDIERVATSPVDQENNEELAMKLSEKIQRLAQFITSPFSPELQKGALPGTRFRIPIDTPALRVIRSASWDALLYFSYFDLKAEEALVNLYKNPEHTAFLAAHVFNLRHRFAPDDLVLTDPVAAALPLQESMSSMKVPSQHAQYADFFQFHDRFLKGIRVLLSKIICGSFFLASNRMLRQGRHLMRGKKS